MKMTRSPLSQKQPQIDERLVRDENTNELYHIGHCPPKNSNEKNAVRASGFREWP